MKRGFYVDKAMLEGILGGKEQKGNLKQIKGGGNRQQVGHNAITTEYFGLHVIHALR